MILGYSPGAQQGGPPAVGRYKVIGRLPGQRSTAAVTLGRVTRHQGRGPRGGRATRWEAYCARPGCRWEPARFTSRHGAAQALDAHYTSEHS